MSIDQISLSSVPCIILLAVAAVVAIGIARYTAKSRRVRTVPEGYVLRLTRLGKHSRVVGPGLQTLWPDETDAGEVLARRREVRVPVPEIFTHGGLPVTVTLSFALALDFSRMGVGEIYYSDEERQTQLMTALQGALQQVVAETPPATSTQPDPNRVDAAGLFSPFVGQTRLALMRQLHEVASERLTPHGILLTKDPIVVVGLGLPREIVDAYTELVRSNFEGSARYDFIRRVRAAAPQISDAALVQLSSKQGMGDLRTIFTSGSPQPELTMVDRDTLIHPSTPATRTPAPEPSPVPAGSSPEADRSYALTADDMALLKPLAGM